MSQLLGPSLSLRRGRGVGISTLADDVRDGLQRPFRELPPKHLYDELGSQLFDQICGLPEYYPTRTERAILESRAEWIAATTAATELVELGAGTAAKTRVLLDALSGSGRLARYIPLDIEETTLRRTAREVAAEYPALDSVDCVVGDFERHLDLVPPRRSGGSRIVALLGGTIGNFDTAGRRRMLRSIAGLLDAGDHLLLGADLVKDPAVIEAAYNDAAGVTARFNRNVLTAINRDLNADFPVDQFAHVAFYDPEHEWIEMRLRAIGPVTVHVRELGFEVEFEAGDEIRTEISAKFTRERIDQDLAAGGLSVVEVMTDPDELFALVLARPVSRPASESPAS
jgi:L-histidine N-alpha-methyltransferase